MVLNFNRFKNIRYTKSVFNLFADKFLRLSLILFINILVARHLKPESFGELNFSISLINLILPLATFGIKDIVIKYLVNKNYSHDELISTGITFKVIGAVLSTIITTIIIVFSDFEREINIAIFFLSTIFFSETFQIFHNYYTAIVDTKKILKASTISLIVTLTLYIIAIVKNMPMTAFAAIYALDKAVYGFFLFAQFYVKNKPKFNVKPEILKRYFVEGLPLLLSGVAVIIYMRIDQIMLKFYLGNSEVGQYAAAVRISELFSVIPMILCNALFPAIINARNKDKNLYHKRATDLMIVLTNLGFLIALFFTFGGTWIITTLYGQEYFEAGIVLKIHIWAIFFAFIGVASTKVLIAEGLQKFVLYRSLGGAILNVVLNFILIKKYGVAGAAISTVLAQFFSAFLFDVFNKKTRFIFKLKVKALLKILPSKL